GRLMDLRLFARVISRFKWVVAVGAALAFMLAGLSYVKIDVAPRFKGSHPSQEGWGRRAALMLTQPGLGWARSVDTQPKADSRGNPIITSSTLNLADTSRFASLTPFYAQMANSDAVLARMKGVHGTVSAAPIADPISGNALPFLLFDGLGPSPSDAAL